MTTLLYIEASPLKDTSHSIDASRAFLEAYASLHPSHEIDVLDLWQAELPPFDAATIEAKFAVLRRRQFTPEQHAKWEAVRSVSQRFNRADKYVFSVPMWNFSIPYPLKHYIDVVTLAGENWTWSREEGYRGLLSGKKALLVYSSAGDYPVLPAAASDFQKPYMRRWLKFLGIDDVSEIGIAPTLSDPQPLALLKEQARRSAAELAASF